MARRAACTRGIPVESTCKLTRGTIRTGVVRVGQLIRRRVADAASTEMITARRSRRRRAVKSERFDALVRRNPAGQN